MNEELILMYRDIGDYISVQSENAEYGDAFVQKPADFLQQIILIWKALIVVVCTEWSSFMSFTRTTKSVNTGDTIKLV